MRIAIDARKLHDYGIGTYVRNVLRYLGRIDRENEYVLLCRKADCDTVRAYGENFRALPEPSANYSVMEQMRLPIALKRAGADVFHAPHYVLPPLLPCLGAGGDDDVLRFDLLVAGLELPRGPAG